MRPLLVSVLAIAASGCSGILGIPSEGEVGCPEPCKVTVSGKAVRAESLGAMQQPLANVTVRLTSVDPERSVVTLADGSYSFTDLTPGTPLEFRVSIAQSDPDPQGLLDTRIVAGTTAEADIRLDLPVVQYQWLAKVAFQCGIFPTLEDALFNPGTMNVNSYFTTRSTVIAQVLKDDGTAAALDRADVSVAIQSFINYNRNPGDTDAFPATVCFLEPDNTAGEFKGVSEDTTVTGRFVLFRARNDLGTGTGMGEVRIPGFPTGPLNVSTGAIGFSRIKVGEGPSLPERQRTFERDVYHFFADKTCSNVCHRPPDGIGFMTAPKRLGPDDIRYGADWSAPVDQVYDNLTKPFDADCQAGGASSARVCKAKPEVSLLYVKPSGMEPMHQGIILNANDPMISTVLKWIQDGAVLR